MQIKGCLGIRSVFFGFGSLRLILAGVLALVFSCSPASAEPATVLVPSAPIVDDPLDTSQNTLTSQPELDLLISRILPSENVGVEIEMPQMLASLRFYEDESGELKQERQDLLGDMEEIRYLDERAWGVNLELAKGGLYQFIMEARPVWDEKTGTFSQHSAKVIAPVFGNAKGWDEATGLSFEILPLNRPFGLEAPALFAGKVLLDGKPLANAPVFMERINVPKMEVSSPWHRILSAKTDEKGQFSFVLNRPGWWFCEARTRGAPLKGPDGQLKEAERGAILWLYVHETAHAKR